jgi:hypothetical protein
VDGYLKQDHCAPAVVLTSHPNIVRNGDVHPRHPHERKDSFMTAIVEEHLGTQQIGVVLDGIIGRLSYDEEFAGALAKNPGPTLDSAGLHLEKTAIEAFIKAEPARFDLVCDRLAELINPDTLAQLVEPTCG